MPTLLFDRPHKSEQQIGHQRPSESELNDNQVEMMTLWSTGNRNSRYVVTYVQYLHRLSHFVNGRELVRN